MTSRFMSFPPRPKYSQGFSAEPQDIFPGAGLQSRAAFPRRIALTTCNVLPRQDIQIAHSAEMLPCCRFVDLIKYEQMYYHRGAMNARALAWTSPQIKGLVK
jgi:hypothetical protein